MAAIYQIRCTWTGVVGGGVTTFYTDATHAAAALDQVNAFWEAIKGLIPNSITINVPGEGASYDDVTGAVGGGWAIGVSTNHQGTSSAPYSAPSGAAINWTTGVTVGRRRLQGRTFLVPLGNNAYQEDGTLAAGALTTLRGAAATMLTAAGDFLFKVWSRPSVKNSGVGTSAYISGSNVPDKAAILTSRRD